MENDSYNECKNSYKVKTDGFKIFLTIKITRNVEILDFKMNLGVNIVEILFTKREVYSNGVFQMYNEYKEKIFIYSPYVLSNSNVFIGEDSLIITFETNLFINPI